MLNILIVNSKGGSGKTTVTTNIASYFASLEYKTAIMDYDPQGSSLQWLKTRPTSLNKIHGANATKHKGGKIRSWQMNVPIGIEILIIDAPAGVENLTLQEMVRKADYVVIPVAPSAIDIHATAHFIKDLYQIGKIRTHKAKLGIVANRVRSNTSIYQPLKKFLKALNIPLIGSLSDADPYIIAAGEGKGICDIDDDEASKEKQELSNLFKWLEQAFLKDRLVSPKQVEPFQKIANLPGEDHPRPLWNTRQERAKNSIKAQSGMLGSSW